jgi:hypothetical protein
MAVISSKDIDDAQTILNRNRSERDRDSTERAPQKQASDNKKPTTEQALMSVTSPVDKSDREPQNKASGNGKPKTVDAEKNQQKTESTQKKTENSPR